ncbi:MAG TPA: HD domain-containing protein [Candidatus Saccharimonadales bacterium]|nr:HD domain-containing protein [Candidatus Saccharimonadales bacterium]
MKKPDLADLQRLVTDVVLPFYQIRREVPLHLDGLRYENDAEHSWSLALLACALAPHVDPKLDIGKVAQYATVHDMVEIHAGDTSNFASDSQKASKEAREAQALRQLETSLAAFPWAVETLHAYEAQTSDEAQFVRSVDKILPLLFDIADEGWLYHDKKMTQREWVGHMQIPRTKASRHSGAFAYYELVWDELLSHPEFFHQEDKK